MRSALVNDYLAPAAQLIAQFGLETTLTTARQLGVFSELNGGTGAHLQPGADVLTTFLSQPVSLLGLAQAYATLDNQGVAAGQVIPSEIRSEASGLKPYAVLRLEDQAHQVWLDWSTPVQQGVLSPQLAYLINHSLSDEVARWNSLGHPNPLEIGRPAGVKLGQTLQQQDAWAFGYTPQRLVGVWLGLPDAEAGATVSTSAAAALWHAIIQSASRGQPADGWQAPLGISQVQVCDPSGLLPTIYCPLTVSEVFLTGSEPTQADNLYRLFQINRETGRLATVFTAPELIEEKVFLIIPSEARAWAAHAGLPTPPEDYDVLSALPVVNADVNLSAPAMFSHVRGEVTLSGSAKGAGFQFFRLNFGQGLNPQQWLQIGFDNEKPVQAGKLGIWDTAGLNGLYALQLQVVRLDQRVETALLQVTVDNIAPEITLLSPQAGGVYFMDSQPNLVLNARASDNLELAQVEFYIDDQQVASLVETPYLASWPARQGEHTLKVIARDLAGNESANQIIFTVKQ
jgi:membrane carboxypeptidase/penicillin-binding protein PbpC